jgi:hypothetical protein
VKAIQARVPATEILMLPKCKHSPHRDQPDATLDCVAEFVARVAGNEEAVSGINAVVEEQAASPE